MPPLKRTLAAERADGTPGLTLDQLAALLQSAMRSGATGEEIPKVTVTVRGHVKQAEITIVGQPAEGQS